MSDFTTQFSRISHHTVALSATTLFTGSTFTVPGSELIDDTWSIYDLALSEIGVDEFRDKAYIRIGSNIKEINLGTGTTSTANQNLNQVLTVANTTGGKDIEVTNGDVIRGQSRGIIDTDFNSNSIMITYDNTNDTYIQFFSNAITLLSTGSINVNTFNFRTLPSVSTTNAVQTDILSIYNFFSPIPKIFKAYISCKGTGASTDKFYSGEITGSFTTNTVTGDGIELGVTNKIEKYLNLTTATADFVIVPGIPDTLKVTVTGEAATNLDWSLKLYGA